MGAVTLHNWLRADASSQTVYCPASLTDRENPDTGEIITGSWRDNSERHSFLDLQPSTTRNYSNDARCMRENFTRWFTNEGCLSWQR